MEAILRAEAEAVSLEPGDGQQHVVLLDLVLPVWEGELKRPPDHQLHERVLGHRRGLVRPPALASLLACSTTSNPKRLIKALYSEGARLA